MGTLKISFLVAPHKEEATMFRNDSKHTMACSVNKTSEIINPPLMICDHKESSTANR